MTDNKPRWFQLRQTQTWACPPGILSSNLEWHLSGSLTTNIVVCLPSWSSVSTFSSIRTALTLKAYSEEQPMQAQSKNWWKKSIKERIFLFLQMMSLLQPSFWRHFLENYHTQFLRISSLRVFYISQVLSGQSWSQNFLKFILSEWKIWHVLKPMLTSL